VAVVTAARRDLENTLTIASELEPLQQIDVYAKVSGYIKTLNIDWGTHVRAGDTLAVLEIPELAQELQMDESEFKVAELTYNRLADVQRSQPNLVAQQDIDVAQGKELSAKAALDRDRALYSYSWITAPFDGVVTRLDAYKGALLPAGTSSNKGDLALCHLSQTSVLRLVIPVPERAVPFVRVGEPVAVAVSALNRAFDGKVSRFSGQIDPDTRTMHTEVQVPNPGFELVPGMYASVELPLQVARNVVVLPIQALQLTAEGRGTVLVVDTANRIERREVTVGLETATAVEVASGVSEGERVVFGSQGQYQTGQLVTPASVDSGAEP
jgi:RND family efflux transporter MFP subunit